MESYLEELSFRVLGKDQSLRCTICGQDAGRHGSYREGESYPKIICSKCAFEKERLDDPEQKYFCDWCGQMIEGYGWFHDNWTGTKVCSRCIKSNWKVV